MESTDSGESEKKRPAMARNSVISSESKSVDAAVLQYQNQKLKQQLDAQKHELHDLEAKIQELNEKQSSYDSLLMKINQLWSELDDDLVLLARRAGADQIKLQSLENDHCQGSGRSCAPEDMFLYELLKVKSVGGDHGAVNFFEQALDHRQASTMDLMKLLEATIKAQREKIESTGQLLHGNLSPQDKLIILGSVDSLMDQELKVLQEWFDLLRHNHDEYRERIQYYLHIHPEDQAEIKHIAGELEETLAELEESRRKLVNLQMQKNAASGAANGDSSPKNLDVQMGLDELKRSIEEAQIVAEDRLVELEEAREDNLVLSKQLEDIENECKDDKFIYSCRLYILLKDQLQHWKAEVDRYKALTDSLQVDRSNLLRRDKELESKAESTKNQRSSISIAQTRVEELEAKLQNIMHEKNDFEIELEDKVQDLGRKDIKAEFELMTSALSKEMQMMEAQLNRWKDTSIEALSLNEEAESLKVQLMKKTGEVKELQVKHAQQLMEIKSLKELTGKLEKENQELELCLDMYGEGIHDTRTKEEIQESERRAHLQAEVLNQAFNEHGLELRIRAASEAEVACQQRLSTAEAEIADLRVKLDDSERAVIELKEAIRGKEAEAEAYISEIETIGQAYEDMQAQNQHLLKQMTERDDYNIKLVSESVKAKQTQNVLLSEKEELSKQLEELNSSLEYLGARISQGEEQMKAMILEARNSIQQDKHLSLSLETAKWELADTEKELKWLKSAIVSSEKEHEQIQLMNDEIQAELHIEKDERLKLEEEIKEWTEKVAELSSQTGEAAIQKLEEEIKECKSVLKCGVCFDRPKEVVIVKCFHLFCNQCIQRNLEIRHRKCPGCGTAFGQNDVRFVKI